MRSARAVFDGALGIAALLLVFWVIGVVAVPSASGLTAVGAGIHAVLSGFVQIIRGL